MTRLSPSTRLDNLLAQNEQIYLNLRHKLNSINESRINMERGIDSVKPYYNVKDNQSAINSTYQHEANIQSPNDSSRQKIRPSNTEANYRYSPYRKTLNGSSDMPYEPNMSQSLTTPLRRANFGEPKAIEVIQSRPTIPSNSHYMYRNGRLLDENSFGSYEGDAISSPVMEQGSLRVMSKRSDMDELLAASSIRADTAFNIKKDKPMGIGYDTYPRSPESDRGYPSYQNNSNLKAIQMDKEILYDGVSIQKTYQVDTSIDQSVRRVKEMVDSLKQKKVIQTHQNKSAVAINLPAYRRNLNNNFNQSTPKRKEGSSFYHRINPSSQNGEGSNEESPNRNSSSPVLGDPNMTFDRPGRVMISPKSGSKINLSSNGNTINISRSPYSPDPSRTSVSPISASQSQSNNKHSHSGQKSHINVSDDSSWRKEPKANSRFLSDPMHNSDSASLNFMNMQQQGSKMAVLDTKSLIYVPFNKLYKSNVVQLANKNTLILSRASKTTNIANNHGCPRIVNGKKYRCQNILTESQSLINCILQSLGCEGRVLLAGAHRTKKRQIHASLVAACAQIAVNVGMRLGQTAYISVIYEDDYNSPAQSTDSLNNIQIKPDTNSSLASAGHSFECSIQMDPSLIRAAPIISQVQRMIAQSRERILSLPYFSLRSVKITMWTASRCHYQVNILSTCRIDSAFIESIAPKCVVWSIDAWIKSWKDTQKTLETYAKFTQRKID